MTYRIIENKPEHEIRADMQSFVTRWRSRQGERSESQSFWNELFEVFGYDRKREGVTFELPVKMKAGTKQGFIDVHAPTFDFFNEQKGSKVGLDTELGQSGDYFDALAVLGPTPRYMVKCSFHRFRITDTRLTARDPKRAVEFSLDDLEKLGDEFASLKRIFDKGKHSTLAVDIITADRMADLYKTLVDDIGEDVDEEALSMWLTRVMFCFYAEDTGIFPDDYFTNLVESSSSTGGGLRGAVEELFKVLNTPQTDRDWLDDDDPMVDLPYVNGDLFADRYSTRINLRAPQREALRLAGKPNWIAVNPTIFGAMFQNAASPEKRRSLGEHYTSEDSILRALRPLILDELDAEFEEARLAKSVAALETFHDRLARLQFLDPAAGCGNFLLIAYRELRKLEQRVYRAHIDLANPGYGYGDSRVPALLERRLKYVPEVRVKVANFHGIEIGVLPTKIAEVAIYMEQIAQDKALSADLAMTFSNMPLKDRADMHCANAATLDWSTVVAPSDDLVIVGNPPYNGTRTLEPRQKIERDAVWKGTRRGGSLDYVSVWFRKAAEHVRGTRGRVALVSTNSIVQGEQVAPLWGWMREQGIGIDFAHQTFAWSNEARGMAHVHVIIIGFSDTTYAKPIKTLFTYPDIKGAPKVGKHPVINSYLVPGADVIVEPRTTTLSPLLSAMRQGTAFVDGCGGKELSKQRNATLTMDETGYREAMADPIAAKYVRPLIGSDELIKGNQRWCLWLVDANEADFDRSPVIRRRLANLATARRAMKSPAMRRFDDSPLATAKFPPKKISNDRYLVLPRVNGERRMYMPSGYVDSTTIATDGANVAYEATLLDFAVASSRHMRLWAGSVAGRMKSDIRYGAQTTWNTFALPNITDDLRARIEAAGQAVLDARDPSLTLADQYDPDKMPAVLRTAHQDLDYLLDEAFELKGHTDVERLAALFDAYAYEIEGENA